MFWWSGDFIDRVDWSAASNVSVKWGFTDLRVNGPVDPNVLVAGRPIRVSKPNNDKNWTFAGSICTCRSLNCFGKVCPNKNDTLSCQPACRTMYSIQLTTKNWTFEALIAARLARSTAPLFWWRGSIYSKVGAANRPVDLHLNWRFSVVIF